jgi:excisionase family DNA binding protein
MEERCYLDETASHLGVDRTTLYRWIRAGTIHPRREPGGRQFFYRSELDDLMDPQGHVTRPLMQLHDQLHRLAQKLRLLDPEAYPSARHDARRLEGMAESLKPLISTYIEVQVPNPLGRPSKLTHRGVS